MEVLSQAVKLLGEIAEGGVLHGRALCALGVALARGDRVEEAEDSVQAALAIAARLGDAELRAASLGAMGEVLEASAKYEKASSRFREAAEVARDAKHEEDVARMDARAAIASLSAGSEQKAAVLAEEAVRLARRLRLEPVAALGATVQAVLAIAAHPDSSFVPGIVRAIDRLEALGRFGDAALAVSMLARAHLLLGDSGAASRSFSRATSLAERAGWASLERRLAEASSELPTEPGV